MEYRLKLRNEQQAYWIYKIGMGRDTDEEIRKWYEMSRDRLVLVGEEDLELAIGKLEVYADIADDNGEMNSKWTILRLRDKLMALKK